MLRAYLNFARGVSANRVGQLGVALTTASFALFLSFELLSLLGVLTNAYLGLITYLTLPATFIIGLLLIPLGWMRQMRLTGKTSSELLAAHFEADDLEASHTGARVLRVVAVLTLVNLLFLGGGSSQMLRYMDQPEFCGTACHVMNPEWTAYQDSPHANVDCVACHVGEGAGALFESKISGLRQSLLYAFDSYSRPIPTPVHQLRPARETCQSCHSTGREGPPRLHLWTGHAFDEASTPQYSTLAFSLDAATGDEGLVHWHVRPDVEVRYTSVDDAREHVIWTEVEQAGRPPRRFRNARLRRDPTGEETVRVFDCVDCHNRVAHVYEAPERAVDRRIARGEIDRALPFAKRQALAAVTGDYPDLAAALSGIRRSIESYYMRRHAKTAASLQPEIERTVESLQAAYRRNVHPEMAVGWDTYLDHQGHRGRDAGCFRCHNRNMVDDEGVAVRHECTLCHAILADESPEPFSHLAPNAQGPDAPRSLYLREAFERRLDR